MTIDYKKLRLFGVYQQDKEDNLMLRVKVPAGFLTSAQAGEICTLSEQFSNGILHLTCRGSIEFHWLRHENLEEIFTRLANTGLTTQGACGGAVRGISCSTTFTPGYAFVQQVAQRINRHFAGNPDFEGLPKKFKIGIETGYQGSRHLIQDIGLVQVETIDGESAFDIWCAGGLGREPQASFLLEEAFPEKHLIHLIESIVQVYRDNTPPPKRLKYLLNTIGEPEFRRLLQAERKRRPQPTLHEQTPATGEHAPEGVFLEVPVFAGEIESGLMRTLAAVASDDSSGHLAVTADQNIALLAASEEKAASLREALQKAGVRIDTSDVFPRFRVCPGSHECRMGLAPTRDIARQVSSAVGRGTTQTWAISGCRNSCSQPQLADFGIVTKTLVTNAEGEKEPIFDLYQRNSKGLGECISANLDANALYTLCHELP